MKYAEIAEVLGIAVGTVKSRMFAAVNALRAILEGIPMNCDSARTEIIAYLKNELEPGKRKRLEDHLAKCPDCRKELEQARRLLTWTEAASDEAVVAKVEEIFQNAMLANASDIHFESQRDDTLARASSRGRRDARGRRLDSAQRVGVLARLRCWLTLNVADTSLPQDGRIKWTFRNKE